MNYQTFMETLQTKLQEALGNDVQVITDEIVKNNNVTLPAIIIKDETCNLSPCIYVDKFYKGYLNGDITLENIVQGIVYLYTQNMPTQNFDTRMILDYSYARKYLRMHLINTNRNIDLLENLPHREFLDLSIIYCIDFPNMGNDIYGSIRISNRYLELWKMTEEELYEQSRKNMEMFEEGVLENLADALCTFVTEYTFENNEINFIHILTNKAKCNGASQMLNRDLLNIATEIFKSDVILLPSSIHEMLLIPVTDDMETTKYFAEIVKEINDTQVEPNEILSYHVYRYEHKTGIISIVA